MSADISASSVYAALPIVSTRSASTPPVTGQAVSSIASNAAAAPHPSPVSLLDPSTGLVVLEFYNAKGVETSSLPTKKALENYRLNEPSTSVFQPAVHDGTVPQPSISDKSPPITAVNGTGAVQASVPVQATATAASATVAAQSAVGNSSGAGSFGTHA